MLVITTPRPRTTAPPTVDTIAFRMRAIARALKAHDLLTLAAVDAARETYARTGEEGAAYLAGVRCINEWRDAVAAHGDVFARILDHGWAVAALALAAVGFILAAAWGLLP